MRKLLLCVLIVVTAFLFCGASGEKIKLPVVMYHSVNTKNINDYVIHPDRFESDLLWLKEHGYTSVFSQEVIDYVNGKGSLPSKPVMLFFDDGFYNNLVYALPLLQKHGFKAMIAVVGEFSDKEKGERQSVYYSNLNWVQIQELSNSGNIEIVNHTYALHGNKNGRKGAAKKYGESLSNYKCVLSRDIGKLQDKLFEITGRKPLSFCYPYGKYCEESEKFLKEMGFNATYTCNEHHNYIGVGESLFGLGRFNRSGKVTTKYFFEQKLKLD